MTITKYDRVAILPKRCDKCNRLFWLESYNIFYKTVGVESYSLKQIECKNCINKAESEDKFDVDEFVEKVVAEKERREKVNDKRGNYKEQEDWHDKRSSDERAYKDFCKDYLKLRDIWNCKECEHTEDECKDCYPELGYKNDKLKRDTEAVSEFVKSDTFKKLIESLDKEEAETKPIGLTRKMLGIKETEVNKEQKG